MRVDSGLCGNRWQELASITPYSPAAKGDLEPGGQARALLGEHSKPFQGRVVPSETEESIRLPDLEGSSESGILESGNGSIPRVHRRIVTSSLATSC